jgi:hypothetical protein
MTDTIKKAIEESVSTGRTVHIPYEEWTADDNRALDAVSDSGMQWRHEGCQYWGHDADGCEWSIILSDKTTAEEATRADALAGEPAFAEQTDRGVYYVGVPDEPPPPRAYTREEYLDELVAVGKRMGWCLSHEDGHGAFLIVARGDDDSADLDDWLLGAHEVK